MSSPSDFIDREQEMDLLEGVLASKLPYRILAFLVNAEQGKTYLMNHFRGYCKRQDLPVCLIDFDSRQGSNITYWKFIDKICDDLSENNFARLQACKRDLLALPSPVTIHTGTGESSIRFGKKGEFNEAELEEFAGRDLIKVEIGDLTIQNPKYREGTDPERTMYEMGRAFRSDLSEICKQKQVVVILDTFERASFETRQWLDDWLFRPLLDSYDNLQIIIAGRPNQTVIDYFNQNTPWRTRTYIKKSLSIPNESHVRKYLEIHRLIDTVNDLETFLRAAQLEVALLAKLRDLYLQD